MTKREFNLIVNESENPCISIIIPMHHLSPYRQQNPKMVKKAVEQTKKIVLEKYGQNNEAEKLLQKVDSLQKDIDYMHTGTGIGMYVSKNIAELVKFWVPVHPKIVVENSFHIRDLLYNYDQTFRYGVVAVGKKSIHLYNGEGQMINEIKNEELPIYYHDDYEYARPQIAISYGSGILKEYDKEKSVLQKVRIKSFLKSSDHILGKYIHNDLPIIVAGCKKEVADYMQVTKHMHNIIGKIDGSSNAATQTWLTNLAWPKARHYIASKNNTVLNELPELIGKNMAVTGIAKVWKAAKEGRGWKLLVEKDFEVNADLVMNSSKSNSSGYFPQYSYGNDTVEQIIHTVIKKRGEIIFIDNGRLENAGHIALLLRYPG